MRKDWQPEGRAKELRITFKTMKGKGVKHPIRLDFYNKHSENVDIIKGTLRRS